MDASSLISLLAGLGIGSVLTSFFQHLLKQREVASAGQRAELEKRYRVIILLMYAAFDFNGNVKVLIIQRPDLKNQKDVLEELKAEWHNMLLFASENTQQSLHAFNKNPDADKLTETAISMRRDLGRSDLRASVKELKF